MRAQIGIVVLGLLEEQQFLLLRGCEALLEKGTAVPVFGPCQRLRNVFPQEQGHLFLCWVMVAQHSEEPLAPDKE